MKEIMYSSITGNTKKLADLIKTTLNEDVYCGEIKEVNSEVLFVGFWATKNSCSADVQTLLESLNNKKVFLFGTCGYNNTQEFFNEVLNNVKSFVNSSNEIIGEFVCQGKVSEQKQNALKETHPNYENMLPLLLESNNHPNEDDLNKLTNLINNLK